MDYSRATEAALPTSTPTFIAHWKDTVKNGSGLEQVKTNTVVPRPTLSLCPQKT